MKSILKVVSYLCLILMLISAILTFKGTISMDDNKMYLLTLTVVWFVTAPFWMGKKEENMEEY